MKATLEFNLPEEKVDLALAMRGHSFAAAITDFDNAVRKLLKHGHEFETADAAFQECRELISVAVSMANDCYDF